MVVGKIGAVLMIDINISIHIVQNTYQGLDSYPERHKVD